MTKRTFSDSATEQFRNEIHSLNIASHFSSDLMQDPNYNYNIFNKIITDAYEKIFPEKRIKVNKYRHKLTPWITMGLIKSIEYRDTLYKKTKKAIYTLNTV